MTSLNIDTLAESFKQKIVRKAIVMDIGGFKPSDDPLESWFGKVCFAKPNEQWPLQKGKPMFALAQINLTQFPFKPRALADIEFITLFIGPEGLPDSEPNGSNWLLRAYTSTDELVPLAQVKTNSWIKPFPMKARVVDEDFPCWEDLPIECPEALDEQYYDRFQNEYGFKFGGWPSLVQAEIYWAPNNQHEAIPEYVFQVDSTDKGNWMWADNGVAYYGRGTAPGHTDEWVMEWQCY